jgi:hypothetical protein
MTPMADEGGDAPCWAERVCAHCGAIADPDVEHACLDVVGLDDVDLPPSISRRQS